MKNKSHLVINSILKYSNAPTVLMDFKGNIKQANDAFFKLTGYKRKTKLNITKICMTKSKNEIFDKFKTMIQKPSETCETVFKKKNKELLNVMTQIKPINLGKERFIIGYFNDITGSKMIEEELRQSKDKYKALVDNVPVHIGGTDSNGVFVVWNKYSEEIFGYSEKEVIGKMRPVDLHETTEDARKVIGIAIKEGKFSGETNLVRKNGEKIIAHLEIVPDYFPDGKLKGLYGFVLNMTDKKRALDELRESEIKYHTLFDSAGDGIYIEDFEGNILDVNEEACKMLGYTKKEMLSMDVRNLMPKEWRGAFPMIINTLKRKKTIRLSAVNVRKDGSLVDVDVNAKVIEVSGKKIAQVIIRDITEKKKIEKMKENLLRDLSHELKTPTAMMEMGYSMFKKAKKENNIKIEKKALDIIFSSIKRQRDDINNVLSMFKLESEKKKKRSVSKCFPAHVLFASLDKVKKQIELGQKKLLKKIDKNIPALKINPKRLSLIYNNIIDNAIKFTDRGIIKISLERKRNSVIFSVKDKGRGIDKKHLSKIFDRFYKGYSSMPGVGLGLSICKKEVELAGGAIKISSQGPGKGATARVTFPV